MNEPVKTTYGINDIDGERLTFVEATHENLIKAGYVIVESVKDTKIQSN